MRYDDGRDDSLGVCQVQPKTAAFLGFKGKRGDLMNPKFNVKYAAKYLDYQLKRYNGDVYKAILAYNAGSYKLNSKGTPVNALYAKKVLTAWSEGK